MTYTFWHAGILIGESALEESSGRPRQRSGVFRPTAYGLDIFPRLTGILTAGHALKAHLDACGVDAEELKPDEIEELLDRTPFGQKIIDIGRMLSEVEMRAPSGQRVEFASIAFNDMEEARQLFHAIEGGVRDAPPEPASAGPRYFVSLTLGNRSSGKRRDRPSGSRGRHRSLES
jgi:hypothetical protein